MPAETITKPCAHCGEPILQTRNNKAHWATVVYCDNACKRKANRSAAFDDTPPPDRIEIPNPHLNWRPKGKKHKA